MRILIQEANARPIRIWIPTHLLLNRIVLLLTNQVLRKNGCPFSLTQPQIRTILRAVYRTKRRLPGWRLVEVESADGDRVTVRL